MDDGMNGWMEKASRKTTMTSPRGGTPKILISILSSISCSSGIWGIFAVSGLLQWSAVCCYLRGPSSANIKIFSGQGLDEYMRNVVYREVFEM
jgi:hypothetical protein